MAKEKLLKVISHGADGKATVLDKTDGVEQFRTFQMYLTEEGTPVYKESVDPGIDQEGDPFNKPKKSVRERWAGIDQPLDEMTIKE